MVFGIYVAGSLGAGFVPYPGKLTLKPSSHQVLFDCYFTIVIETECFKVRALRPGIIPLISFGRLIVGVD